MARTAVVKARTHHGSRSLDLTIPVSVSDEFGILPGDVFSVEASMEEGQPIINFRRVLRSK